MKRILAGLATGVALMALCGAAIAQDADNGERPRRERRNEGAENGQRRGGGRRREEGLGRGQREGRPRQRGGPRMQGLELAGALKQLELTEDQKARIQAIFAEAANERRASREEVAEQLRAVREELEAARESGDREAMRAAQEKMTELNRSRATAGRAVRRRIARVLSRTQRAKLDHLMGPAGGFEQLLGEVRKLNLESVQQRQIREIAAQANAEARMKTEPPEKAKVYRQAAGKIMELLTDEQKAQLRRLMATRARREQQRRIFADLNLSDEQEQAIEAIREEARRKIEQAETPEARREAARRARGETTRRIFSEVLSEEQKQQLRRQMQQRRRQGGGGEGRPRRERGERGEGRGRGGRRGGDGPAEGGE